MKPLHTLRFLFVFTVVLLLLGRALAFAQGPNDPGQPPAPAVELDVPLFDLLVELGEIGYETDDAAVHELEALAGYSARRMRKPAKFTDLEAWVSDRYASDSSSAMSYLPATLREIKLEYGEDMGKPAIMFETTEMGARVLNTLVDAGESLHLYRLKGSDLDLNQFNTDITAAPMGDTSASACNACNCVLWVRCAKAPWLPYGLTTLDDKRRAINSYTAGTGKVAVHNISYPYGHVSYITGVSGSRIYIQEANYRACRVTTRSGTQSDLKIIGYIKR